MREFSYKTAARGLIECPEASRLAKELMQENAEFARLSQSRVFENFSFRANVIAFLKAMVLYVAHGMVWHETMEDFIRWSLQYDLWCKMHFFGQAIEEQENAGMKNNAPGPQNLLDLLPEIFTREEAGMLRQRQGIRNGSWHSCWATGRNGATSKSTVRKCRRRKSTASGTSSRKPI